MNKIGKPLILSEDNEYKNLFLLKGRRKGRTESYFATVINSIMEHYDFIVIQLSPFPFIIQNDESKPVNFTTREEANTYSLAHCENTIIIDIKKLQSEKEIDDMSANISW